MSIKIKNKHRLKQKDKRKMLQMIQDIFDELIISDDAVIETGRLDEKQILFIDEIPCFFKEQEKLFFTIPGLLSLHPSKREVVVDMGAVRFVTNGADVMSPGIVDADDSIVTDQEVWISDEQHHKPLAVGIALMDGETMVAAQSGKAVEMKHFIGDQLWKKLQTIE